MQRIRQQLASGADFAALAQRESESSSRDRGGDMGWIDSSTPISRAQVEALTNLKPGQVSGVVELGDGYQILKLAGVEEPKPGFDGARETVVAHLRQYVIASSYETAKQHMLVKVGNRVQEPENRANSKPKASRQSASPGSQGVSAGANVGRTPVRRGGTDSRRRSVPIPSFGEAAPPGFSKPVESRR
jgi:hypothetical protein